MAPGGRTVFSEEGTRLLWEVYPTQVRNWIRRKGGLTPRMIFLRGKELAAMYTTCPQSTRYVQETRTAPSHPPGSTTLFAATRKAM
jgi:hypothetical protein